MVDSVGTVGDVMYTTGSVQRVRQVRKVMKLEPEHSPSAQRRHGHGLAHAAEIARTNELPPNATSSQDQPEPQYSRAEVRELLVALRSSLDVPPPLPSRIRRPNVASNSSTPAKTANKPSTPEKNPGRTVQDKEEGEKAEEQREKEQPTSTFSCCDRGRHHHHHHHPGEPKANGSQCECCPFGFHIAMEFVEQPTRSNKSLSQLQAIRRRNEQLARTRVLLNEHDDLCARVAIANARVPPSPSNESLPMATERLRSRLAREIDSALDVQLDQFAPQARLNGHADNHNGHSHLGNESINCPICNRHVPMVSDDVSTTSRIEPDANGNGSGDEDEVFDSKSSVLSRSVAMDNEVGGNDCKCGHAESCASMAEQLARVTQALRIAEQQVGALEAKLAQANTPKSSPAHTSTRVQTELVKTTNVGVGYAETPKPCEQCAARRRVVHSQSVTQTETSVRNVAIYHKPSTRQASVGPAFTMSTAYAQTEAEESLPFVDAENSSCNKSPDSEEYQKDLENYVKDRLTGESLAELIQSFASAAERSKNAAGPNGTLRVLRAVAANMSTEQFQSLFRTAFRRDVRSVELQAAPRSATVSISVSRRDFEKDAACGADGAGGNSTKLVSAIGVQCEPGRQNKAIVTDSPIKFDVGSITRNAEVRTRASQTEAVSCEPPTHQNSSSSTNTGAQTDDDYFSRFLARGNTEPQPDFQPYTNETNDQLLATACRREYGPMVVTPGENDRTESFMVRPTASYRFQLGQRPQLSGNTCLQSQSSTIAKSSSCSDATVIEFGSSVESLPLSSMLALISGSGSGSGCSSGGMSRGLNLQRSILKKSNSKPESPVASPFASPNRPRKSISFASQPLVVGSSESSLSGDEASSMDANANGAIVGGNPEETADCSKATAEHHGDGEGDDGGDQDQDEDDYDLDDLDDLEDDARARNTALNSYTAFSDLSGLNEPRDEGHGDGPGSSCFKPSFELPGEVRIACENVENWLEEPHLTDLKDIAESSMSVIATEWFRVATEPHRDAVEVLEDYLRTFNDDFSGDLLERVVRLSDESGNTAMHYALWKQQFDVVDLLLSTEACDCNATNTAGYSCIMLAAESNPRSDEHYDVLRRVFESGDVNQRWSQPSSVPLPLETEDAAQESESESGPTALLIAASRGDPRVVRMLLDCGADVNVHDAMMSTALHCAVTNGHPDSVIALLESNADVNAVNAQGSTPLHLAAERGSVQIVKVLLADPRCNFSSADDKGLRPIDVARTHGRRAVAAILENFCTSSKQC